MSLIIAILLIALAVYVLRPILHLYMMYRRARKQAERFYNTARGGDNRGSRSGYREPSASSRRPRKKIDPDVGEYVEYEEISTYDAASVRSDGSSTEYASVKYKVEEQISDAEWEEA